MATKKRPPTDVVIKGPRRAGERPQVIDRTYYSRHGAPPFTLRLYLVPWAGRYVTIPERE